jgi:hypothetical protein
LKGKWLAVGIILLFLGVSIAPSINQSIVKASQNDDLIEVTTQVCGISGFRDTTVKLTRQQYTNLEQYLVEVGAKLNQTSSREKAIPIFKEAVVELNKYGLLPKGMSVERAQKLMTGKKLYPLYKCTEKRLNSGNNPPPVNAFCFVFTKLYTWENELVIHMPLPILLLALLGFNYAAAGIVVLLSMLPTMISIFSVDVITGGYKNIQTFGIHGKINLVSYHDVMLCGFVGLKIWNSFSDDKDGFLVGWTVSIYDNPFENSTYFQTIYN